MFSFFIPPFFFDITRGSRPPGKSLPGRFPVRAIEFLFKKVEERAKTPGPQSPLPGPVIVDLVAVNHKAGEEKLRDKVDQHGAALDQKLIPVKGLGEILDPEGGQRRKHAVEGEDLRHCHGDIGGGMEGEFAVHGEVIEHGADQADQIGNPIQRLVGNPEMRNQEGDAELDEPGGSGKQGKLDGAYQLFAVFHSSGFSRSRVFVGWGSGGRDSEFRVQGSESVARAICPPCFPSALGISMR